MMKNRFNNSGTTLAELVASLPLGILVFLTLVIVLINFMTSYQEVRLFTQCQDELFSAVQTLRYGYLYKRLTGGPNLPDEQKKDLIGLLTANKVDLGTNPSSVIIKPTNIQGAAWAKQAFFYVNGKGELMVNLSYPLGQITGHRVFPSSSKKIGNDRQFKIIDENVFSIIKGTQDNPQVIGIHLKARVRFRKKSMKLSSEEDLRLNTKTVEFDTRVFLGNSKG